MPEICAKQLAILVAVLATSPAWSQTPDWRNGILQVEAAGQSPGTGFIVALRAGRAYVVTCAHVVSGDAAPMVTFNADPEKRRYRSQVRDADRRTDLALLVVEKPPTTAVVVDPRLGSTASAGADVWIGGYPGETGGTFTVLRGGISSVSGTELSISPAAEEGFSGGPVVGADGHGIGVVFAHTRTFGKAIPAAIVDLYLRGLDVRWGSEAPRMWVVGPVRQNARDGLMYVWIPQGKFMMGCSPGDAECGDDEKPAREVTISRGFWMGQTEVTQTAYQQVMGANPSYFKGAQRPVEFVSWEEAGAYCGKVGLRLPTEAEWEYAARAGNPNTRYGELGTVAWYDDNTGRQTHDVKQKQANHWGLYDMLGNVWEWTADLYGNSPDRVARGGSCGDSSRSVRASGRLRVVPSKRSGRTGFRCAGELR